MADRRPTDRPTEAKRAQRAAASASEQSTFFFNIGVGGGVFRNERAPLPYLGEEGAPPGGFDTASPCRTPGFDTAVVTVLTCHCIRESALVVGGRRGEAKTLGSLD